MNRRDDPNLHHRRSIRLPGHDYARSGAYYVTIVTRERVLLFGDVIGGEMRLNDTGQLILDAWEWLAMQYPYVELDSYIIMPNHLHGIIVIIAPTSRKPLGRLVGAFKTVTTKQVNLAQGTPGQPLWQRNYYEHVIRDDEELARIREYIVNNPMQWEMDAENPDAILEHPCRGGSRTAPTGDAP